MDFLTGSHLTNSSCPKIFELSAVQPLAPLAADSFLELLLIDGRRVLQFAFIVDELAALKLGTAFSELFNSLVGNGLNPTSLLAIGFTSGRKGNESTEGKRVGTQDKVRLAARLEVLVAVGVRGALLALRLEERDEGIWHRHFRWYDLLCRSAKSTIADGKLLLPVPSRIGAEQCQEEDHEWCYETGLARRLAGNLPRGYADLSIVGRLLELELCIWSELLPRF